MHCCTLQGLHSYKCIKFFSSCFTLILLPTHLHSMAGCLFATLFISLFLCVAATPRVQPHSVKAAVTSDGPTTTAPLNSEGVLSTVHALNQDGDSDGSRRIIRGRRRTLPGAEVRPGLLSPPRNAINASSARPAFKWPMVIVRTHVYATLYWHYVFITIEVCFLSIFSASEPNQ